MIKDQVNICAFYCQHLYSYIWYVPYLQLFPVVEYKSVENAPSIGAIWDEFSEENQHNFY